MTYPLINDKKFQDKIAEKYSIYETPRKRPSFTQLCFPEQFTHQLPQLFVSRFINPKTPYKGLLIFHKIGAGKTCAAVMISLQWLGKRKVIFIVPASLIGNVYKEFRSQCAGTKYVSKKEAKLLDELDPRSREYQNLVKEIDKRIDEDIHIYSFHKYVELVEKKKMDLRNSIVIVDEVQNIVSDKGLFYRTTLESFQKSPASTRIVVMSATPIFDKPVELALTLNLLRPTNVLPTGNDFNCTFIEQDKKGKYKIKNKELLKEMISGYISYSPGAPAIAFPEQKLQIVKCEMSKFQFECYRTVEEQEGKPDFKNILKLSNAFFIGSRMISNVCFPNKKVNENGYESFSGRKLHIDNINRYSIKFQKILQKIKAIKGPAIVYSNFREYGGLEPFTKFLEYNGYINVVEEESLEKKYNKKRFGLWTGRESMSDKELSKSIYNHKDNFDGSMLKIMIISPSGKEGLSLFRTRSLHIMEPYWNSSRLLQVIGRGIRYCSHKDLPPEERVVQVFLYLAVAPIKYKTIDEYIYKMMLDKDKLLYDFYKVMEESAVDKKLFANAKKFA